jgi:hypothetical protein
MLPLVRLGMAISGQRIARNYPATAPFAMLIVPVLVPDDRSAHRWWWMLHKAVQAAVDHLEAVVGDGELNRITGIGIAYPNHTDNRAGRIFSHD